jgi:hypothetical protein
MRESPIQITLTIHLVLSIDPTEQCPLAAVAEFLTEQSIESTLLESLIESLNEQLVETFVVKNTHTATGTSDCNAPPPVLARRLLPPASTNSLLITSKTPLLAKMNPPTFALSKTSSTSMGRNGITGHLCSRRRSRHHTFLPRCSHPRRRLRDDAVAGHHPAPRQRVRKQTH